MIHNTAVIDQATSKVVNVIVTDDEVPYQQEAGFEYVASDEASIGDTYEDGEFIKPPVVTPHD